MKKNGFFTCILLLSFILSVNIVSAHQPEYVDTQTSIHIPDPDTSRAYYGELAGVPAVYTVSSTQDFSLYLNILSPYSADANKDFIVTITNATGTAIATLSAPASGWQEWYEEFAGDTYWKGPEFKQNVPAGTYTISVANPGNEGRYVLSPGEAEVFTVSGTPSAIHQIYLVKTHFFGKSWYSVFQGIIGKALFAAVILFVALLSLIVFFVYKRIQKRKRKYSMQL